MVEKIGHIRNPLTVIAIFAAIAEISGTTVLPFIESENQSIYIWFLMLFPIFLVGVFFITLNFNHKVLYAPSDYKNEDNFLKSFGKATFREKERKLKQEVEEAEEEVVESRIDSEENEENNDQPNRDGHSKIIENVTLAEKLAIQKLSKEFGVEFKTDVRFETPTNRKILFDGLAIFKDEIHAVEVKLLRNGHINRSAIERVLLESELMNSHLNGIDTKKFKLHFVAVIDNPEVDLNRIRRRLMRYIDRYDANVMLHITTLNDLKNEYQFSL